MKLAHFADQHLGSSGNRLDPETGLNAALMDRFRCSKFVVDDAIEQGAELILSAGDLFHTAKPSPTEAFLAREVFRTARAQGVPVVALLGNHEAPRGEQEKHALELLRGLDGVTIVDRPMLLNVWNHERAPFMRLEMPPIGDYQNPVIQIACLPYPNLSLLLKDDAARRLEPGERNLLIREHMMNVARGLAAQWIEGVPHVLLGHFSVDVAVAGAGDRLMMLGAEFNLNLQDLEGLGFDAVLLGHIHKMQLLGKITSYSGSPEACSFSEEGEPKGYQLMRIDDCGISYGFIETPYRKLVTLDESESPGILAMLNNPPEGESLIAGSIVRVKLPAACSDQANDVRKKLEDMGAVEVRVEIERAETIRRREVEVSAGMDLPTAIRLWAEQKPDLAALTEDLVSMAGEVAEGGAA